MGEQWKELLDWAKKHMLSGTPPFASAADLALPSCVCDIEEVVAVLDPHIQAFRAGSGR